MSTMSTPKLEDPSFEPTDQEWSELLEGAARVFRWEAAMADAGVKILAMGLIPEEMQGRAMAWEQEQCAAKGHV